VLTSREQEFGSVQTRPDTVLMRRNSKQALKLPDEVKWGHINFLCNLRD
jgi:hypothetical protein